MKQKLLLLTTAAIAAQGFAQSPIAYPKTKTVNQVDEYFGCLLYTSDAADE